MGQNGCVVIAGNNGGKIKRKVNGLKIFLVIHLVQGVTEIMLWVMGLNGCVVDAEGNGLKCGQLNETVAASIVIYSYRHIRIYPFVAEP